MLTIRTCVALVLLVVVLLPNTFKIVTILEIHTDGLSRIQQQQQQQVNVGGRKVTSPPQPPASVPGSGGGGDRRWRSNEEILLEFMSHLKQNDPKAIAIHKEYQSTNNSTEFLRATRDFLFNKNKVEDKTTTGPSTGNQPPPPPPPPVADVGNDKCRNLLQHNNMRKTRTLIVFSGPSAKTEAKHKLYEQNMEYFLTRGGVPKGDSCCNPRDGIGNGPNYDSSIDRSSTSNTATNRQQQQQQIMLYDTVLVVGHEYYDSTRQRVQRWKDEQVANHNNNTCFEREHQKLLVAARDPQCYDMETARLAIHSLLGVQMSDYDYLVYVNCGMTGPFGPKKKNAAAAASSNNNNNNNNNADNLLGPWNGLDPWPTVLTSRINHRVKMTGLSINTYDNDGRSNQPHIQSFLYAMDQVGIQVVKDARAVFDCRSKVYRSSHAMVLDVIDKYEIGMSRAILSRGYAIQPLLDYYNCTTVTRTQLLCRAWDMWYEDKLRQFLPPESFRDGTLLERSFFVKSSRFLPLHPSSAPIFGTVAKTAFNASTTPSDWTLNQQACRCVDCDDDDLCGGLWHANRFQPLDFDEPQHKLRLHLVVSHCKKDLSWITSGFIPPSYHNNIKSVRVITKCGEDVTGEPPNSTILVLPNVGRCDHSYAYYILNLLDEVVLIGDNEQDGANNSIVLFLKDDMSAENFHQEGGWNDFESIVRVASSTNGFACGVETSAVASAYHDAQELFNFRMAAYDHKKDLYGEGDVQFKSNYSDLGAFYLDVVVGGMGSAAAAAGSSGTTTTTSRPPPPPPPVPPPLPGLVQVCYGGVFAASYPNIRKVDRSVWERIEKTLSRGNSIEEGHHMERSWAMLLATPLRSFQVEAVRKYGRPRTFEESEFQPGILEAIPQRQQQQQHGRGNRQHVQTSPVLQHFHRTRPHRVTTRKHFRDMEKFHMGGDAGDNAPTTNTGKRFRENRAAGGGGTATTTTTTTKPTSTSHKRVVEGGGSLPARHFLTKPTTTTSAVAEKRDHSWMRKISKPT